MAGGELDPEGDPPASRTLWAVGERTVNRWRHFGATGRKCSCSDEAERPAKPSAGHRLPARRRRMPRGRAGGATAGHPRSSDDQAVVTLPPAAAIFSLAEPEAASTVRVSTTPFRSPSPSTLTFWFLRTAPAATSSATPTVPPCGNSVAKSPTLITW